MLRSACYSFRQILALIRLRAFDTSTAEGRGRERERRAALTIAAGGIARPVTAFIPFFSVPLALHYLGEERYGLWITISSMVDLLVFADLGIGNGLVTALASASGRDEPGMAARWVSSGFFLLIALAAGLLMAFGALAPWVPWSQLLNTTSPLASREAMPVVMVCLVGFCLSLPLDVVRRVQDGYQEGFKTHLFSSIAAVLGLIALILAVQLQAGLPRLVLCLVSARLGVAFLNGSILFGIQRPGLRPRWKDFDWATAKKLFRLGLQYFLIAILMTFGIESDNLVATRILGPEAATQLSIPSRLFAVILAVAMMLYLPMWSAYGEALSRGDVSWVRTHLARLTRVNLVTTSGLAAVIVVVGGPFLRWWLGPDFPAPTMLLVGLGLWPVVVAVTGPGFMVMNGARAVAPQVVLYLIFAPTCILVKVVLGLRFGIAGIAWANPLCYALLLLIPVWVYVPRLLDRLAKEHSRMGPPEGSGDPAVTSPLNPTR